MTSTLSKSQQITDDLRYLIGAAADLSKHLFFIVIGLGLQQQLCPAGNNGQRIVQLMGRTGGHFRKPGQ